MNVRYATPVELGTQCTLPLTWSEPHALCAVLGATHTGALIVHVCTHREGAPLDPRGPAGKHGMKAHSLQSTL